MEQRYKRAYLMILYIGICLAILCGFVFAISGIFKLPVNGIIVRIVSVHCNSENVCNYGAIDKNDVYYVFTLFNKPPFNIGDAVVIEI